MDDESPQAGGPEALIVDVWIPAARVPQTLWESPVRRSDHR